MKNPIQIQNLWLPELLSKKFSDYGKYYSRNCINVRKHKYVNSDVIVSLSDQLKGTLMQI